MAVCASLYTYKNEVNYLHNIYIYIYIYLHTYIHKVQRLLKCWKVGVVLGVVDLPAPSGFERLSHMETLNRLLALGIEPCSRKA